MSGMVEVLAAHEWSETYFTHDKPYECICGERVTDIPNHQTEMLASAGFGPVKEAAAKALEEAADELARMDRIAATPVNKVTQAEGTDYVAFLHCEGDINWLRARAAAVRGEG